MTQTMQIIKRQLRKQATERSQFNQQISEILLFVNIEISAVQKMTLTTAVKMKRKLYHSFFQRQLFLEKLKVTYLSSSMTSSSWDSHDWKCRWCFLTILWIYGRDFLWRLLDGQSQERKSSRLKLPYISQIRQEMCAGELNSDYWFERSQRMWQICYRIYSSQFFRFWAVLWQMFTLFLQSLREKNSLGNETRPNPSAKVTSNMPSVLTSMANTEGIWPNQNCSIMIKYMTITKAPEHKAPTKIAFNLKASFIFCLNVNQPLSSYS